MKAPSLRCALALVIAAALPAAPLQAQVEPLPPTNKQGTVEYLTGGIGSDESGSIKRLAKDWPLTLEFSCAVQGGGLGQYLADVLVDIRNAQGASVFQATATGPYMLLRLGPGRYTVHATWSRNTLTRQGQLQAGTPVRAAMAWPAKVCTPT
jgi:hypothetical protein